MHEHEHEHEPKRDPERWVQDHPQVGGRFDREVATRTIVGFGIGIVVLSVVSGVLIFALVRGLKTADEARDPQQPVLVAQVPRHQPPAPRLQVTPELDLRAVRAGEDSLLGAYGWLDEHHSVARIPIERAMELMLERGYPVRSMPREWTPPGVWRNPSLVSVREVATW